MARPDELHLLAAIEVDAFWALHDAGAVACEPTSLPIGVLRQSLETDLLFVAVDALDQPFGFLAGIAMADAVHIAEIDVIRHWQKKGVGRRLMQAVIEVVRTRGASGVTLTTDRHVSFNAPFYASLGFSILDESERSAELSRILEREVEHGAEPARRVAMALWF
ncbi:GNAT family N-acetyltransferase [Rhizobium sp. ICMP 5592]|uniref:GNAT family N-acetyltransferase n=1 Tax=Rhizobium sp. ICMP 5592 TaxID=2292445 RepID=UPI00257027CC|nr:GNAT family N-acetyltransferase [Rhizobium sp. ICMP 5592]